MAAHRSFGYLFTMSQHENNEAKPLTNVLDLKICSHFNCKNNSTIKLKRECVAVVMIANRLVTVAT